MRKIDRAFLKRTLGGEYPNGPRGSWTLRNDAEGRVYLLGWSSLYRDQFHPLRSGDHYPDTPEARKASKFLAEWHAAVDAAREGALEPCLLLQVPRDPDADVLQAERVLDAAFFGEIVERDGGLHFRADERRRLNVARAPRQESA